MKQSLLSLSLFLAYPLVAQAQEVLVFDCTRSEKDYTESYALAIAPANQWKKAKIFLDDRDLDRKDEGGYQEVKSIIFSGPNIVMTIEARFDPELIDGITYPPGKVLTQLTLNRNTGNLNKVETIQGGILGVHFGNGSKVSEEQCNRKLGTKLSRD
jgi:hypothetical protein